MATLTDEQLADLKQKAMAATPGPWCSDEEHGVVWIVVPTTGRGWSTDADGNAIEVPVVEPSQEKVADASPKDAAYIAAANPENILALLQRIGELEAELADATRERDEAGHSSDINQAAARIAIERLAKVQWARGHSHGNLQQTELSLTAVIYSELGGGPSPEAVLSMELPELKTHKLEAALAIERAAVEVLAEIAERCQADSRGCEFCYVRGGCDPDNMAKCARAEARKRLGLGEEGGDAGWQR